MNKSDLNTRLDECLSKYQRDTSRAVEETKVRDLIHEAIRTIGESHSNADRAISGWSQVEAFFQLRKKEIGSSIDYLIAHCLAVFYQLAMKTTVPEEKVVIFDFGNHENAIAFSEFMFHIVPIRDEKFPFLKNNAVMITAEQYFLCTIYAGSIVPSELEAVVADHYLLKSLRADVFDYSDQFIKGIIPGAEGSRRQNLRPFNRASHTTTPEGHLRLRLNKDPMYSAEVKKEYSQIQSTTFLDSALRTRVFGAFRGRSNTLYGLLTHHDDALLNRLLMFDGGTVYRPFDFSLPQEIDEDFETKIAKWRDNQWLYSPEDIDKFKTRNLTVRQQTDQINEVMARLGFNPYRSMVCICADTLESRLLAYDFAQELLKEFSVYAQRNNIKINPTFRIPIVFYLPAKNYFSFAKFKHEIRLFTESMYCSDRALALNIYGNLKDRSRKYAQCDYAFLLGLPEITATVLLEEVSSAGVPLALDMIRKGYVRMLMRLFKLSGSDLSIQVFDELLKRGLIKENDSIIAEFISVEAFEIADRLIQVTNSDKYQLPFRGSELHYYLITRGNPRQLNYMGLDKILMEAAEADKWFAVRLCLKEYPNVEKSLLGQLLWRACDYREEMHAEADFLLKMGADKSASAHEGGDTAIVKAAKRSDWLMVGLFSQYVTDPEDKAGYGHALVLALVRSKIDLVRKLLEAGAKPGKFYILRADIRLMVEHVVDFDLTESMTQFLKSVISFSYVDFHKLLEYYYDKGNDKVAKFILMRLVFYSEYHVREDLKLMIECAADLNVSESVPQFKILMTDKQYQANKLLVEYCKQGNYKAARFILMLDIDLERCWCGIEKNDPLISQLICAEEFDIADRLIVLTTSEKYNLYHGEVLLADFIISSGSLAQFNYMGRDWMLGYLFKKGDLSFLITHGNLRQWIFVGLDRVVLKMAQNGVWNTVMSLVETQSTHFSANSLGKLLVEACQQRKMIPVDFLLRRGADRTVLMNYGSPSLVCATEQQDWWMVTLFSDYQSDPEDNSAYGYAVTQALRYKKIELAKALFYRGAIPVDRSPIGYHIESALFYAVQQDLVDWVPELIEYELGRQNTPWKWIVRYNKTSFYRSFQLTPPCYHRVLLARDLAEAKNNPALNPSFLRFSSLDFQADETRPLVTIDTWNFERILSCQFFLEALAMDDLPFAVHRLLKYAHQYQLIDKEDNNVLSALEIFGEYCYLAIKDYTTYSKRTIYKNLRQLLERCVTDQELDSTRSQSNDENKNSSVSNASNSMTFFSPKLTDKMVVARLMSKISKSEIKLYEGYLARSKLSLPITEDPPLTDKVVVIYNQG